MFSTRTWRLLALIAAIALVNALVLPVLGQTGDPTVDVFATDDTATEEGTTTGVFTLTRTGEVTSELEVDYTVTGTATPGADYIALSGTATFAAGAATTVIIVTPIDDAEVEGDETVIVTIEANAAYDLGDDTEATITIVDNDTVVLPEIEVVASDATATEEGQTTGAFTFTRTGDVTDALEVDYTVTGTATAGADYVALSGTATFAAGAATTVVLVTPIDDALVEGNETVIVTIAAGAAYTVGDDDQATVTIIDNDVLPTVEVTATDDTATEEGTTTGAFTLTRTGDVSGTLTVDYTVTGTATAGADYVALSGTATFAVGAATAVVLVTPIDDALVEGNETVILTLDAGATYSLGDDIQATVTIIDNDEEDNRPQPPPAFVIPFDKSDCKKGGWQEFGVFKNQGDCVSFAATGGKNPPALLGDMTVDDWLGSLDG
ncbi:MAG TPA: Calx-beta domain-containing protein [Acidimicrobiia bacterium]|nr:Calx-beta domain-containing protein [Acidimicrobiia bacterium]